MGALRLALAVLSLSGAACFGGMERFARDPNDPQGGVPHNGNGFFSQPNLPFGGNGHPGTGGPAYNVEFSTSNPQNYDEYGRLIAKYPKDHLINSNTPGYTGTAHFPANIVAIGDGNGNRQLSTADAESALLEAAKAGAHEALDSSTLEDSSLPALMTEI